MPTVSRWTKNAGCASCRSYAPPLIGLAPRVRWARKKGPLGSGFLALWERIRLGLSIALPTS
jgi:hypothetical protein